MSRKNLELGGVGVNIRKKHSLTVSTFGLDNGDAMEESFKKKEGKTTIYISRDGSWYNSSSRSPRAFDSVILAKDLKEELLADITTFRNSAQWYHDRGVPYRRGYLLHGPPGTGKTSFITALAGHLCMSICIVNLGTNGLDDQQT
ncbi:hypothetical protein BGZ49_006450 [Haplosporangium sp. Z 27]|nr:hypothetical protein BGZ49_006450 [Haplosporangium sp. Z 27]